MADPRTHPISSGAHTIREVALLVAAGADYAAIAREWGMRPRAGAADLRRQVELMWERHGRPGGLPPPAASLEGRAFGAAYRQYRARQRAAIPAWLAGLAADRDPEPHCPTCHCFTNDGASPHCVRPLRVAGDEDA